MPAWIAVYALQVLLWWRLAREAARDDRTLRARGGWISFPSWYGPSIWWFFLVASTLWFILGLFVPAARP